MDIKKLGEICDVVSGGTPSRTNTAFWDGGIIPWIKIGNIKGKYVSEADEYITQAGLEGSSAKILSKGTVLYTIFATLGEAGILTIDACTNQAIAGITIKNQDEVLADYLYYYLKSKKSYINNLGRGVAQNNINLSILRNLEIPLPALPVQRQTVDILDKTAKVIEYRRQQLQNLDDLVKARFVEMFGDPLKNEKCLPTISGEALFKLSNGKALPNNKRFDKGVPAYGGNGISWYTDEILCDYDTIIVGRVGFQSGNVHLVKAPLWVTDNAMYISYINSRKCDIRYLCALMEHIDFTRYQDAGDLKKITQKPFMQMHYLMPPLPLQKQYIAFVARVDKSRFVVQQALDKAQLLFDSLMQKYFG